jgi:hypothetical protein
MLDQGLSQELIDATAAALLQCESLSTATMLSVMRAAGVPAMDAVRVRRAIMEVSGGVCK